MAVISIVSPELGVPGIVVSPELCRNWCPRNWPRWLRPFCLRSIFLATSFDVFRPRND